ncbi:MAG: HIT family protein [Candidatus Aenigmarchaeota archaeon]|nr:HIT family protein [Candidatus Aenigmarchaeota archaeon]
MVKLNRHTIDLFDISNEEREEFFAVVKNLRDVLKKLFNPDLFNYASLGNTVNHLHLHVIPRYKQKRIFENREFVDERWEHNYTPYPKDFETPPSILVKLKDELKKNLK